MNHKNYGCILREGCLAAIKLWENYLPKATKWTKAGGGDRESGWGDSTLSIYLYEASFDDSRERVMYNRARYRFRRATR